MFWNKLLADYLRYKTDVVEGPDLDQLKRECTKLYEDANLVVMPPCNPTRLGLILNMSVFYYEVMRDSSKAIRIADDALALALDKLDDLGEEEFNYAKNLIEQLKENMGNWKEETAQKEMAEGER